MKHLISQIDFFSELRSRGITQLFHANSVETSISFFRVGTLLSRDQCIKQKLPMSSQFTDSNDQVHGVWDDIFLNFHDFHRNFKRPNKYGPVSFVINVNLLENELSKRPYLNLHITKSQPHDWQSSTTDDEKWRKDLSGLFKNALGSGNPTYLNGWPDIVLALSSSEGVPLSLCDQVVIDSHPNNENFFAQVQTAFQACMKPQGLSFPIQKRKCLIPRCLCGDWGRIVAAKDDVKYSSGNWATTYGKIA